MFRKQTTSHICNLVIPNIVVSMIFMLFCFQAVAIMEMAHGKDHNYVAEVKREIEEQK